jgi:hypothetical protein
MRIRTARLNLQAVTGLSAAFGLALTLASFPAAAQQWTRQQRAAGGHVDGLGNGACNMH